MTPTGLVIAIVAAPVVLLTLLRANAVMVFLSLCLGQLLVQFVSKEAASTVGIIASDGSTNQLLVSLGLLLIPVVFTTLFMMRSVNGKLRLALNILPALSVGVVGLLLAEPFFAAGLRGAVEVSEGWHIVQKVQVIAVVVSAFISIFFLWWQRPRAAKEGKHHH